MRNKILVAALLATFSSAANAESEFVTARVSYADLDIGKAEDLKRLGDRVNHAIRRLCRQDSTSLDGGVALRRCRRLATASGEAGIKLAMARDRSRQATGNAVVALPIS